MPTKGGRGCTVGRWRILIHKDDLDLPVFHFYERHEDAFGDTYWTERIPTDEDYLEIIGELV